MSRQVMCITKRGDHYNPHERIQGIGGIDGGVRWRRSEDDAIADVERDPRSYYTSVGGRTPWLIVAMHERRKYLKTQEDGYRPDNLLNLPECPAKIVSQGARKPMGSSAQLNAC
jgi:hypothetical protein